MADNAAPQARSARAWVRRHRALASAAAGRTRSRRGNARMFARRNPPFAAAVAEDVAVTLRYRGEAPLAAGRFATAYEAVRLSLASDAFLAQVLYRGRVALNRHGIPVLPHVAHRLSMAIAQVCIGDPVVMAGGVYIPHGQVVVDGITTVGSDVVLSPWVTIGLRAGNLHGPRLGSAINVGTGAKIIGPVSIGDRSKIGANAVVVADVPAATTAAGVPARPRVRVGLRPPEV